MWAVSELREAQLLAETRLATVGSGQGSGMPIIIMTWMQAPDADKDYYVDWAQWLGNDTIFSATVTVSGSGVLGSGAKSPSHTETVVKFWMSGVVLNRSATVSIHIVTVAGRAETRDVCIRGV